ncbi:MAG TPA: septum site-determining protein MinC [Thermoflexia bacterium]|nr:septum site-determining protein MinC [Thermoflexia bacterium]
MNQFIVIKGTPQGLRLQPRSNNWEQVLNTLQHSLQEAGDFFRGGRVILELSPQHSLNEVTLATLRELVEKYELTLWAVTGGNLKVQRLVRQQGLRTKLPQPPVPRRDAAAKEANAQLVERTLRSGQRLQATQHVILVGDVNPGGEIVANGNIIVWGRVLGTAHAGATGDRFATIRALELNPAQLRIAGLITRSPEGTKPRPSEPEIAYIQENSIVVEPWSGGGK